MVLPFWYRLTRVVLDKGPLNVCVCVRACESKCAQSNVQKMQRKLHPEFQRYDCKKTDRQTDTHTDHSRLLPYWWQSNKQTARRLHVSLTGKNQSDITGEKERQHTVYINFNLKFIERISAKPLMH